MLLALICIFADPQTIRSLQEKRRSNPFKVIVEDYYDYLDHIIEHNVICISKSVEEATVDADGSFDIRYSENNIESN